MKNIVICNFPRFSSEIWLPILWAQAKTYYEMYGQRTAEWNWVPCYADIYSAEYKDKIKEILLASPPDVFAISLYVWNYSLAYEIAEWVKLTWPNCVIVSGGPHQYFKHDINWFKNHKFLDASYPGDCYGEIAFMEMLDNYDNTTSTVDWSKVPDIRYPSKSKMILTNSKTLTKTDRKHYNYNWSAFDSQLEELQDFVNYQFKHLPNSMLLSVIETTRGCPYGCTYCDWGGGTNTTVLQKDLSYVEADIKALSNFDLTYLYLADANFGIFGQRDVDIMKMLANQKTTSGQQFKIGYGGFAKTENKLEYIKEILQIDVQHSLSHSKELKISLQTLDKQVLINIDRKNIDLDKQLAMFEPLSIDKKLPLYVEMIMGLPGLTLDKFYYELDVLGEKKLSVQWFEWILLPETPAYSAEYRSKFKIGTAIKNKGWSCKEDHSHREVVISAEGYSAADYLQMLLSNSMYNLIVQGGFYSSTMTWIKTQYSLGYGELIQDIYENFYLVDESCREYRQDVENRWEQIITDPDIDCAFTIDNNDIYGGWYFVALAFLKPNDFVDSLINWLTIRYNVPINVVDTDRLLTINVGNFSKRKIKGMYLIDYRKDSGLKQKDVHSVISLFKLYHNSGHIFRGQKKLLGVIPS